MTQQDIQTNVVLTADNAQYDQAMTASAQGTDHLGKSLDSLSGKIAALTKSAGRKLIGVSAADTAALGATTLAYGAFEKQMTSLNAQAAVLNKTLAGQKSTMSGYADSVNGLRSNFGMATSEAAELTQTITKLTGLSAPGVNQLAKTFATMGQATQESSTGLANSVLQLQKTMGTQPGQQTARYANQLTVLAANTGTSATALADFAQQLAPVARQVGASQTEVQGLSAAFSKAGTDGSQAANFYVRMMNDISYAAQSGSPRLNEFANLAGVMPEKFKDMSGMEQFNSIITALGKKGPAAINTMNQLGYEGNRMSKIALTLSQQGGIMGMIGQAKAADRDPQAMGRGAKEAMDGMYESMNRLRISVTQMAEAFGKFWAGPAGKFFDVLAGGARALRDLAASPLGQLAASVMGLAAPFIAFGGAVLVASKAIAGFALARQLLTGSMAAGFKETAALTPQARRAMVAEGFIPGVGRGRMSLGPQGANIAERPTWMRRATYNVGSDFARLTGYQAGMGGSALRTVGGLGLYGVGRGLENFVAPQYAAASLRIPGVAGTGGYNDVTRRMPWINSNSMRTSFGLGPQGPLTRFGQTIQAGWQSGAPGAPGGAPGGAAGAVAQQGFWRTLAGSYRAGMGYAGPPGEPVGLRPLPLRVGPGVGALRAAMGEGVAGGAVRGVEGLRTLLAAPPGAPGSKEAGENAKKATTASEAQTKAAAESAKATERFGKAMGASERGVGVFSKALATTALAMGSAGAGMARFGAGLAGQAFSLVGGNWLMAGGLAAFGAYKGYKAMTGDTNLSGTDKSGFARPYLEEAGISDLPAAPRALSAQAEQNTQSAKQSLAGAYQISSTEAFKAGKPGYKLTNTNLKGLSAREAEAALGAQWSYGAKSPAFVSGAASDLTSRFGRGAAQDMLERLQSGQTTDPSFLAREAARPGRSGKMDTLFNRESGSGAREKLDKLYGIIDDTASFLADTKGAQAAQEYQLTAYNKAISQFNKGIDDRGFIAGNTTETKQTFAKSLLQQLGVDTKVGGDQAKSIFEDDGLGRANTFDSFLEKAIMGTTVPTSRGPNNLAPILKGDDLRKALATANVDVNLTGKEAYEALLKAQTGMDSDELKTRNDAFTRLKRQTQGTFGAGGILGLSAVNNALVNKPGDQNAQYQAVQQIRQGLNRSGGGPASQIGLLLRGMHTAGGVQGLGAGLMGATYEDIQTSMAMRAPYQTRTGGFKQATNVFQTVQNAPLAGPEGEAIKKASAQQYASQVQDQYNYFKQQLYQQREYNVMRERSEQAFDLQRKYAQDDYHLQRKLQEEEYQISRSRAIRDFNISMSQAQTDYNISRQRAEEDHAHQVKLMIAAQASAYSNMYERVAVQRTSSTTWVTSNLKDETKRIREQTSNLHKAREMGLSNQAIQQAGLNTPEKAQQLARSVAEMQRDPSVVRAMNRAVRENVKAAGGLATDESQKDWKEFQRSYRRQMGQGAEDFERQMRRARNNFQRGLGDQQDDYQRMLGNQETAQEKMMNRMVTAHNTAMTQAAEDLARSAQTIDGNFETILTKATKHLSGHARKQAQAVKNEFDDLKTDTSTKSVELMTVLSDIFGFNWKPPASAKKGGGSTAAPGGSSAVSHVEHRLGASRGMAAGGVMPGYTPGRDIHTINVSGGEAVMRPEWARAVGKETIDQMNHRAAHGGYKQGGVVDPDSRVYMDGEPVSRITKAQLLLAERLGHLNLRTMQGSWQPRTSYSGTSHMGPGVVDESPGNFETQYWMRKVGFAAWGRNFPGAAQAGSGAHVHAVSRVDPGARSHSQLSSFARGEDGLGGHDYGPNPPVLPNLMQLLSQFSDLQLSSGSASSSESWAVPSFSSLVKDEYPKIENLVASMVGVHLPRGVISGIINKMARSKYRKLMRQYQLSASSTAAGTAASFGALPQSPSGHANNQETVQRAMKQFGWNQWPSLYQLVMHESGFNNHAQNPSSTAHGMFQFLNSTWATVGGHKTEDPWAQAIYGMRYIKQRYHDPNGAWRYWQKHSSYADGSLFDGAQTIEVGEKGPEAVIPLNERGIGFMTDVMRKHSVGSEARGLGLGSTPVNGSVNVMNYQIDKSTTFTGPITVQANDPNELISKLQARNRLQALARPALGGSRV